jgi:hypothetical protein
MGTYSGSAKRGKTSFQFGAHNISWHHIEQVFVREKQRQEQQCTRLSTAAVHLDSYSKMRVSLAKVAVDPRVATEMLGFSQLSRNQNRIPEHETVFHRFTEELQKIPQDHPSIPCVWVSFSVSCCRVRLSNKAFETAG